MTANDKLVENVANLFKPDWDHLPDLRAARAAVKLVVEECARDCDAYGNDRNVEQNDDIDRERNIARRDTAFFLAEVIRAKGSER